MAYEVFDDVAFYYLLYSVLAIVLSGHLLWLGVQALWRFCWRDSLKAQREEAADPSLNPEIPHDPEAVLCDCRECDRARQPAPKTGWRAWLTPKRVLLGLGWAVFLVLLVQLPHMEHGEMVRFDPFEVLGLDEGVSDPALIKRAYRKASLRWHPDKNQGDPEAERMFLMVTKAYDLLTDPVAQENMERYGNPDGPQGVSRVTIGLPSFLTRKENEFPVLMLYLVLFVVLPPVGVWWWWKRGIATADPAQKPVMPETLALFVGQQPQAGEDPAENTRRWKGITETLNPKTLVSVLACAAEFLELARSRSTPAKAAAYAELVRRLRTGPHAEQIESDGSAKKQPTWAEHRLRAWSLLQAHMLREPVPAELQDDLKFVLQHAHKLCLAMAEIALWKGARSRNSFDSTAMGVLALQQYLTQALWIRSDPWEQIPGFGPKEIRACQKKFGSFVGFRAATEEELTAVLGEFFADRPEEWATALAVIRLLPRVALSTSWETPVEGFFLNDQAVVHVDIKRLRFWASKAEREQAARDEAEGKQVKKESGDDEKKDDKADSKDNKDGKDTADNKETSSSNTNDNDDDDDEEDSSDDEAEQARLAAMTPAQRRRYRERKVAARLEWMHEEAARRQRELRERQAKMQEWAQLQAGVGAPRVRAPRLPFPKTEGWVLLLARKDHAKAETRILSRLPLQGFAQAAKLPVRLPVGPPGCTYQLILRSDSYLGCDVMHAFVLEARHGPRPAPGTPEAEALERHIAELRRQGASAAAQSGPMSKSQSKKLLKSAAAAKKSPKASAVSQDQEDDEDEQVEGTMSKSKNKKKKAPKHDDGLLDSDSESEDGMGLGDDGEDEDEEFDDDEDEEGASDSDSDAEEERRLRRQRARSSRRRRDGSSASSGHYKRKWYEHPVVDAIANGAVLFLLGFLGKTWLESRGYDVGGYVRPVVDAVAPVWRNPVVEPVLTPIASGLLAAWTWLGNALHREPPVASRRQQKQRGGRGRARFDSDDEDEDAFN